MNTYTAVDLSLVDTTSHDRYLIYDMLGREVSFNTPLRGRRVGAKRVGVVEQVYRNIFENVVELTMSGRIFQFGEPAIIIKDRDNILFVYGDISSSDLTDDELFEEMAASAQRGETLQDVLNRTQPDIIRVVSFALGELIRRRSRPWKRSTQ